MIVYIIGNFRNFNSGHGGHYHSVLHTARQMQAHANTLIYSIGQKQPDPLSGCKFAVHIDAIRPSRSVAKLILDSLKRREAESTVKIVHGFDYNSAITSMDLAKHLGVPLVITKCGGAPISWMKPVFPNTILFHERDLEVFRKRTNNQENIRVISHRVGKIGYDKKRAEAIFGIKKDFVIFRIGRIGLAYQKSIVQAIDLVSGLNSRGLSCRLEVIGHVEDAHILAALKNRAESSSAKIRFHVDHTATSNAAQLLGYCDAAVATGRGAMEAMSMAKAVLFPCANRDLPCILNKATWSYAARENFSQRVMLPDNLRQFSTIEVIAELLGDVDAYNKLSTFSRTLFEENYNIETGMDITWDYYQHLDRCKSLGHNPEHILGKSSLPAYYLLTELYKRLRAGQ